MDITKNSLEEMYYTMTISEMREALGGVCVQTIYNALRRAGIPKKRNFTRNTIRIIK